MTEAYVFDAIRTPRGKGKKDGSLHEVKPVDLLAGTLTALKERHDFDTAAVDDVVMGVVSPIGEQGSVIAKVAALKAGWDWQCAGVQLNRFCASGLEAVNMAAQKVRSGWEDLVVAGGVESMSRVPIGADGGAWAQDPATNSATDFVPQGVGADLIATLEGFSREDVDRFAVTSQQRAAAAREAGRFKGSVVPVTDFLGQTILEEDEFIKPRTTVEALAGLKPSFEQLGAMGFDAVAISRYPQVERITHVHHAGNSSGIVDGAAAVLVARGDWVRAHGLQPLARVVAGAAAAVPPEIMGIGPAPAIRAAARLAGIAVEDIGRVEINEAFGAQYLACERELALERDKANVHGGAIAIGHPLGASGVRLTHTVARAVRAAGLQYGVASACAGGGQGVAVIVENVA